MLEIVVDGPADPRVAEYCRIADGELIRSRGLFVAEGRLLVERVIRADPRRVRSLLLGDAAFRALAPVLGLLEPAVPVYRCSLDELLAITGFNIHRGCLALVERPAARQVSDLVSRARVLVVLEAVANADNVGGVFRNAAAFAVDGVVLSPTCCDPLYRKALRTSMGAALRVPFAREGRWPAGLEALRAGGFTLVALTPRASQDLEQLADERLERLAWLVGSEGSGLSPGVEAMADRAVRIPMLDGVDSLNLAVATGIALSRTAGLHRR